MNKIKGERAFGGQQIYEDHNEQFVMCAKCGEFVSTHQMWLDRDNKQKHFGCLSKKRRDEINSAVSIVHVSESRVILIQPKDEADHELDAYALERDIRRGYRETFESDVEIPNHISSASLVNA
jgi:hypothetical protein